MMKYIKKSGLVLGMLALLFSSCKKQLEIDPRQSIAADGALSSREAVEAVITSVYARLKNARQYGRDMITHPEALADNGFATNKSGRLLPEANNNFGAHFTGTIWSNSYAAINQINLTLEALQTLTLSPAITTVERDRWEGQLYFLRALYLFDLARVYSYVPGAVVSAQDKGGVPIILRGISSVDSALTFRPGRAPQDDVYAQVVADFTTAQGKLLSSASVNLANKQAAQALLARVNLYRKNYGEAKRWADSCIALAGSKMTTTSNYVNQWRVDTHGETLFQVRFATNGENIGVNESLQTSFSTLTAPGNTAVTGGFGDLVPSISLLNELGIALVGGNTTANFALNASVSTRNTDVRNLLYEPGTTGRGPAKVECTKFLGKNGSINLDNIPVVRISEIYLTRAEAMSTPGSSVLNEAAAIADLKLLKVRRYTDYTGSAAETADGALTGTALLDEIIRQRRIELAFEGHRFFDLKRLGRDIVKGPHYNTVAFTDIRILPAIPQGDVDGNTNLKQNAGY
ncbi:MAG: RagB/SusD family nutrient uptake outer membrane protein [Chitinophagaceae bacterium]|nr:RagB/SusD family nutrient uptake outer membrane protein [Chitinophagaceae bacterium]